MDRAVTRPAEHIATDLPDAPLSMPEQPVTGLGNWPARRPEAAATVAARHVGSGLGVTAAGMAGYFYLTFAAPGGIGTADILRAALIVMLTGWLAWGAALALLGLFAPPRRWPSLDAPTGRTAILVPVHNEDAATVMAGIAAMGTSLALTGQGDRFEIAILSDTTDPQLQLAEEDAVDRLRRQQPNRHILYRHRTKNTGRKAGNIADFLRNSGGAYDFAIVLDADSLMSGETLVEMVRRIAADPGLGLLQTLPVVTGAQTRFGRLMQFAAALYSPVYARGLAEMQGRAGPYWGHNAIFRVRAFAESCGLPALPGRPPLGGPILSHDIVEAALMVRAGWRVRLDPDLSGSYERTPETLVDHAARDRRWCQGNLQHLRLLTAPGLTSWSRLMLALGAFTYIAPLMWGGFIALSLAVPMTATAPLLQGPFFEPANPVPVFSAVTPPMGFGLLLSIFGLLILPKLLIAGAAMLDRRAQGFGGRLALLRSVLAEIALSTLLAPILLAWQARSVVEVALGRDFGWPVQRRDAGRLTLAEAWRASHWVVSTGLLILVLAALLVPGLAPWLAPVAVPMIAAPGLIVWSSGPAGRLFATPADTRPDAVLTAQARILTDWRDTPLPLPHDAADSVPERQIGALASLGG